MTITAPIPLSQQVFCDFLTKISKKRLFSKRITETGLIKKYKYLNSTFQRAPTAQCRRTVEEAAATTLTPFPREPSPGHSRASSQEQPPTSDLVSPSCNNRWRHHQRQKTTPLIPQRYHRWSTSPCRRRLWQAHLRTMASSCPQCCRWRCRGQANPTSWTSHFLSVSPCLLHLGTCVRSWVCIPLLLWVG